MSIYVWQDNSLCFTANTVGSTIQLTQTSTPTSVTLETSTDWNTWSSYTIWDTITLSNVGDKIYWRNTSTTNTWFSLGSGFYRFVMTWSISASWDTTSLINKNWTNIIGEYAFSRLFQNCSSLITPPELPSTTLDNYCYYYMFNWCTWLTEMPKLPATTLKSNCYNWMFIWCTSLSISTALPATTLGESCYYQMFYGCTSLTTLPKLSATTLPYACYYQMFRWCSSIRLSSTQTWIYQTAYRIPSEWTWTAWQYSLSWTFYATWWTFTDNPSINKTYYTSNTVV